MDGMDYPALTTTVAHDGVAPVDLHHVPMTEFFVGKPPHRMYVQLWHANPKAPARKGRLLMIHGGAHTGAAWTTTPDGRPGWALLFAAWGWDVHVVDWPGVGRSGVLPDNLSDTPADLLDALQVLVDRIGPTALIGHSIGGALAFKLAERLPNAILAVAAMAPASVQSVNPSLAPAPLDTPAVTSEEAALHRFANAPQFPAHAFETYFASLIAYGPRIRNAAVGLSDELRPDPACAGLWRRIPALILAAEEDRTVPPERIAETARTLGVPDLLLGRDWGLHGHGHLFVVELGSGSIAARVERWLTRAVQRRL
jgi:alpha-beta hydrolase superfamily lysophospholipase